MDTNTQYANSQSINRIDSIDFFRGLTMFLLMGESTRLFAKLGSVDNEFIQFIGSQLSHHEWHGLTFWDLIQPFFMFIVGVSIPLSVASRVKRGNSDTQITRHAFKRSFLLLFLGWALYCIEPGKIVFRMQDVLTQLSFTYLVAFLIMRKSVTFQVVFTLIIILLTDLTYRLFPVDGFNQPWVVFHNFGAWFNNLLEGVSESPWASINAIQTIAHTVWGVLCGKLLLSDKSVRSKIQIMLVAGVSALIIGYSLDFVTPIIKKIATSSFIFASGGWTILAFCFSYWLIDVKELFLVGSKIFTIVGRNCIIIYLFFETGGSSFLSKIFNPFTTTLFSWSSDISIEIINSIVVWASLWYITYWLYKNKLFIKI